MKHQLIILLSVFSILSCHGEENDEIPTGMKDIETFLDQHTDNTVKFIIDRNLRWRVRDMLDSLNISERLLYPGLEGLSKWIARHYYVK